MPGLVFVGFGLWAIRSVSHCRAGSSRHMAPVMPGCPGKHVQPLLPSRRVLRFPRSPNSTILAFLAISGGPPAMALSILASFVSSWVWANAVTKTAKTTPTRSIAPKPKNKIERRFITEPPRNHGKVAISTRGHAVKQPSAIIALLAGPRIVALWRGPRRRAYQRHAAPRATMRRTGAGGVTAFAAALSPSTSGWQLGAAG